MICNESHRFHRCSPYLPLVDISAFVTTVINRCSLKTALIPCISAESRLSYVSDQAKRTNNANHHDWKSSLQAFNVTRCKCTILHNGNLSNFNTQSTMTKGKSNKRLSTFGRSWKMVQDCSTRKMRVYIYIHILHIITYIYTYILHIIYTIYIYIYYIL